MRSLFRRSHRDCVVHGPIYVGPWCCWCSDIIIIYSEGAVKQKLLEVLRMLPRDTLKFRVVHRNRVSRPTWALGRKGGVGGVDGGGGGGGEGVLDINVPFA